MSYRIEEIEGVGSVYAEKLAAVGVNTTEELLDRAASKKGRAAIAEETCLPEKLILK